MRSGSALSNVERRELLLLYLQQQQRATVVNLSQHFSVSVATVRRDLEILAEQGGIERFHGGAKIIKPVLSEQPVLRRSDENSEEKRRIGAAAAKLIQDGDSVFLGSGTTVLEVARQLHQRRYLTVITNSLLVLNELSKTTGITAVGLGGVLQHSEMSMIGHLTDQALAEVQAQKIIIGVRAIDNEHGLTNDYLPETNTNRTILMQKGQIIVVADHGKCGRVSTVLLAPVSAIDILVTDDKAPPKFVEDLKVQEIDVLTV